MRGGQAYAGISAKYCSRNKCKLIWQIAGTRDIEPFKWKFRRSQINGFIDKKILEFGIRRADYIVGQTSYQDDLLYRNYKRRCNLVIPNYHPKPPEKIEKKPPIKIVWIANFKEQKRPELFIRLAKEFSLKMDLRFIMIGRGSKNSQFGKILKDVAEVNNLEYRGELPIDEVNQILSMSHIFVNTSRFEGFPNTYIQAWMRKVPVVTLEVDMISVFTREALLRC
jgi:glycosyltransferase involved in cell wall biosynthesis